MSPHSLTTPLKLLACLHLLVVACQPILAGQYLIGHELGVQFHGQFGELAAWLALAQVAFAVACWWTGRLFIGPTLGFVSLFALVGLQVHAGHNGYLALHVPLGSFLLVASTLMTIWIVRIKEDGVVSQGQA